MTKRILIVDDSANTRGILRFMLASQGFEILEAQSGQEAIEKIRSSAPHLVILDGMMPGMSGFEACRELKRDPKTSEIPILLLTAAPQRDPDRDWTKECPADRFMAKPFRLHDLLGAIERLLGIPATGQTALRQKADLDPEPKGTHFRQNRNPLESRP